MLSFISVIDQYIDIKLWVLNILQKHRFLKLKCLNFCLILFTLFYIINIYIILLVLLEVQNSTKEKKITVGFI